MGLGETEGEAATVRERVALGVLDSPPVTVGDLDGDRVTVGEAEKLVVTVAAVELENEPLLLTDGEALPEVDG